jgi:hypothetical protein
MMKNLEKDAGKKGAFHHQLMNAPDRDQSARLGGTSDARSRSGQRF